jgi:hypothetical protein
VVQGEPALVGTAETSGRRGRSGPDQQAAPGCAGDPRAPLTAAGASGYIRRHLEHVGRSDTLFSDDAVRAIHARGLPRAINRLAVTALLAACAAGTTIVDESSAPAISGEAALREGDRSITIARSGLIA